MKKLLHLILFQLSMFFVWESMSEATRLIFVCHWQQLWCTTLAMHSLKRMHERRPRQLWAHNRGLRQPGFFYQNLLGSFNAREFKGCMRMDVSQGVFFIFPVYVSEISYVFPVSFPSLYVFHVFNVSFYGHYRRFPRVLIVIYVLVFPCLTFPCDNEFSCVVQNEVVLEGNFHTYCV